MKPIDNPVNIQWELTPVCNHNCIHCYNYWRNDDVPLVNPDVDYLTIAKLIAEAEPVHVVMTGGEPLLVFDKIIEAADYLFDEGVYLSWNTNAALATPSIAKQMKKWNASAFVSLPCSNTEVCDRIVGVKGSLKRISDGINTFISAGVPVAVNMVVSSLNQDYIFETAKYAKALGVDHFCIAPASRPFGADEAFSQIEPTSDIIMIMCEEIMRIENTLSFKSVSLTGALPGCAFCSAATFQRFAYAKTCTAGRVSCAIDSIGNVKACARDIKDYGNIFSDTLSDIWKRMSEWRDGSLVPTECKECRDLNVCNGGCRLEACSLTGKRNEMDTFANTKMLPLQYEKRMPEYHWNPHTVFKVHSGMKYKKESFGWRISLGPRFTYITEITKNWLKTHDAFSLEDMIKTYGDIAESALKTTILVLINSGMIVAES